MPNYARLWAQQAALSRADSEARAARVLQYPDLVKRLSEPPLNLSRPTEWNGWIPPRTVPEEACTSEACTADFGRCTNTQHRSRFNDSVFRKALVDIVSEALRREQLALDEHETEAVDGS